jgi:hypothetical protein
MKPIHKFNGGKGATLCHTCHVTISVGLTNDLYCKKCNTMAKRTMPDHPAFASDESTGLTKREYFAAMAMMGILSSQKYDLRHDDVIAQECIIWADRLIKHLNKNRKDETQSH